MRLDEQSCYPGSSGQDSTRAQGSAGALGTLEDVELARRFRDEVMAQSPGGRAYIGVVEEIQWEFLWALFEEPSLYEELAGLWSFVLRPSIENLLDGDGSQEIFPADIDYLNDFIHKIYYYGDAKLRRVIDRERDRLGLWDLRVLYDQPISELVRRWENAPIFQDRFEDGAVP